MNIKIPYIIYFQILLLAYKKKAFDIYSINRFNATISKKLVEIKYTFIYPFILFL